MKGFRFSFQVLIICLLTSCLPLNRRSGEIEISNLATPLETKILVELEKDEFVYKADLIVSGESNGTFKINNWAFHGPEIDTTIFIGDYYGPDYPIHYEPIFATEGNLSIQVVFFTQR